MRFLLLTGGKLLKGFAGCPKRRFCNVATMEKFEIVPDVVKVAPAEVAEIKYGNLALSLGNELTPTQVKVNLQFLYFDAINYPVCEARDLGKKKN